MERCASERSKEQEFSRDSAKGFQMEERLSLPSEIVQSSVLRGCILGNKYDGDTPNRVLKSPSSLQLSERKKTQSTCKMRKEVFTGSLTAILDSLFTLNTGSRDHT